MTKLVYLTIGGTRIPIQRDNYNVSATDIVSDGSGTTEAGTVVRDIVRRKVPAVSFSLVLTKAKVSTLAAVLQQDKLTCNILDSDAEYRDYEMYVSNYGLSLLADSADGGIWQLDVELSAY